MNDFELSEWASSTTHGSTAPCRQGLLGLSLNSISEFGEEVLFVGGVLDPTWGSLLSVCSLRALIG